MVAREEWQATETCEGFATDRPAFYMSMPREDVHASSTLPTSFQVRCSRMVRDGKERIMYFSQMVPNQPSTRQLSIASRNC
jgi:hypothetical protein